MSPKELRERLAYVPGGPGVYIFKKGERVLYVGKARDLPSRLTSYLRPQTPKTARMVEAADRLEVVPLPSELDAMLLEASLIRAHGPPYNVRFTGGENYPYIKITVGERWPRIYVTRKLIPDGSLYFGPYPDARAARRVVRAIREVFPLRPCGFKLPSPRAKLCVYYHMGRCPGPCQLPVDPEVYASWARGAAMLLAGKLEELARHLEERMWAAAEERRFEEAASWRDRLRALQRTLGWRKAIGDSRDTVVLAAGPGLARVQVLRVRGQGATQEGFTLEVPKEATPEEIMAEFLEAYYASAPHPPSVISAKPMPRDPDGVKGVLAARGFRVRVEEARGEMAERLMDGAQLELFRALEAKGRRRAHPGLEELRELLGLAELERIEGVDISHTAGGEMVGSVVVFRRGYPERGSYRRYRIKSLSDTNDPGAVYEVVLRRLRRLLAEGKELPNLILVDGGPAQLSAAVRAARDAGARGVFCAAVAKRVEELYTQSGEHFILPGRSQALYLIKRVRDEAHRFALTYHRLLRDRTPDPESLALVPGLGPKRIRELIKFFGSVDKIRAASVEQIARVPGIGPKTAKAIKEFLG